METAPGFVIVIALLLTWNLYYGAPIDTKYPQELVTLYVYPMWRALLVIFLGVALLISPEVGILVAITVFFYFMDIPHFIKPW
jgi:succinate dehydrogenase hydrophobic anchor subunit